MASRPHPDFGAGDGNRRFVWPSRFKRDGAKLASVALVATPDDLSNDAFAFGTSKIIDLAYARVRANRITYVGELGWELYIPTEFAMGVFDAITAAGKDFGLRHAGYHALNSLRTEKGYRHWGHDVSPERHPTRGRSWFRSRDNKRNGFIGAMPS